MKPTKNTLGVATLLLLLAATLMRITGTSFIARDAGKFRPMRYSAISATSIFACAIATGITWCILLWIDRQRS